MCYYNGIRCTRAQLLEFLQKEKELEAMEKALQSGFDYSDWPIIKPNIGSNDWEIKSAHWEFIPAWINSKEKLLENRKKYATLNAKSETLLDSKMFRDAALNRRCLVLSSGFYEWRHYKPEGAKKDIAYPYYITLNSQNPLFYMAGIYNNSIDFETGELINSFAIVTTQANTVMEKIHNTKKRMPTILPHSLANEWISDIKEVRIKEIAAYQYPADEFAFHTLSKDFRTQSDPTIEYIYDELPAI